MMRFMTKDAKPISEQMKRLYAAAWELRRIQGKSNVALLLNVTPQHLNNWETTRPISSEGLLAAQEKIGCDAIWLRDGVGDMLRGAPPDSVSLDDIALLITLYGQAGQSERKLILDLARTVPKTASSLRIVSSNHKPQ